MCVCPGALAGERERKRERGREEIKERQKERRARFGFGFPISVAYHRPAHEAVFDHEVFDERAVDLAHVLVVVGFAEAGLAVCADGPAEEGLGLGSHL